MPTSDELLHIAHRRADPEQFAFRLASDVQFAAEIRYASEHGIPRSRLLGRVPGVGEPEWTSADLIEVLAYQHWCDDVCPGCGIHPLQWPEASTDPPFDVEASRCPACLAKGLYERHIKEHDNLDGVRLGFVKVPGQPTLQGLHEPFTEDDPAAD